MYVMCLGDIDRTKAGNIILNPFSFISTKNEEKEIAEEGTLLHCNQHGQEYVIL